VSREVHRNNAMHIPRRLVVVGVRIMVTQDPYSDNALVCSLCQACQYDKFRALIELRFHLRRAAVIADRERHRHRAGSAGQGAAVSVG
jgi:hypothetical protein